MVPAGERLHALDALRATAMFLGIVLHAFVSFAVTLPIPWIVRDVRANPLFDLAMGIIHGFRMPLFFFIAGFFAHLLWRRLGTRGFIAHRWRRIGWPFLLGMVTIMPLGILIFIWAYTGPPPPAPRGPPTMHLWFLEMLLVLYAITVAAAWAVRRWRLSRLTVLLDNALEGLLFHRGKAFVLALATMLPLWSGPGWGEVDQMGQSLLVAPRAIAYFGLFFAVGWWLHRHIHLLDTLRENLAIQFVIAFLALVMWFGAIAIAFNRPDAPHLPLKVVALAGAALYAWTMTFALTGLFLRIASRARPWARYLADASYWCYLAHLPLIFVLQVWVARWELPGWLKAWFIIAVACAILLASYALFVRYTRLGALLNGPRRRPLRSSA